jgi:hypothetical protein
MNQEQQEHQEQENEVILEEQEQQETQNSLEPFLFELPPEVIIRQVMVREPKVLDSISNALGFFQTPINEDLELHQGSLCHTCSHHVQYHLEPIPHGVFRFYDCGVLCTKCYEHGRRLGFLIFYCIDI